MTAANFAAYTRSTAFSVSLSAKMIDRILSIWKLAEVASRYDWWKPPTAACATGEGSLSASTDAALTRRGLLEHDPDRVDVVRSRLPGNELERPTVRLTRPGGLMAELLVAAEFPLPTPRLHLNRAIEAHPDDCDHLGGRHSGRMVWLTNDDGSPGDCEIEPIDLPRDRRLDLWQPGDEHYFGHMALNDKGLLREMVIEAERASLGLTEPRPKIRL